MRMRVRGCARSKVKTRLQAGGISRQDLFQDVYRGLLPTLVSGTPGQSRGLWGRLGQVGGWGRLGQVGAGWRRLGQVGAGWGRLGQVGAGWGRLGQVGAGWGRLAQVGAGWGRLGQVGAGWGWGRLG